MGYDDKICEAIEYIVDNAVKKADYDKTIQANIVRTVDQTIGKFSVKYQDSIFYAYGDPNIKYSNGAEVYVLIPGNDTGRDKTILGSTKKLGVDYVNNPESEDAFETVGANVIKDNTSYNLCSYYAEEIVVYDAEAAINEIGLDPLAAKTYITGQGAIKCGMTVRTALPIEQQIKGNYGIIFTLTFKNKNDNNIDRQYIVDINQMTGNPYKLTYDSKQSAFFEIDKEGFVEVKRVSLFVSDFPNSVTDKTLKPDDIFISNLELCAVEKLSSDALNSYSLSFITPQGTYFDTTASQDELTIQAQVRVKGAAIDPDSQSLDYYWFVENTGINYKSEKYHRYAGAGWECINEYEVVSEVEGSSAPVVAWIPASYQIKVKASDVPSKEKKYKCVVVYNDENLLTREITLINLAAANTLTIESDQGTQFYLDQGNPTLTCYVNGAIENGYNYSWGKVDNNGVFTLLDTEGPILENFDIGTVYNFVTLKCTVTANSGVILGTAQITLTNSAERQDVDINLYTLEIVNGTQVFQYDEQGLSPASAALDNPMVVLPLSFVLYENKTGEKIEITDVNDITWKLPIEENSMLEKSSVSTGGLQEGDYYIYHINTLNYLIRNKYDAGRSNNNIKLEVKYDDMTLYAETNFTFVKQGDPGTNGTSLVCKILPNGEVQNEAEKDGYPMIINGVPNWATNAATNGVWFKAQLWEDGELIYDSVDKLNDEVTIEWSILSLNKTPNSNLSYNGNNKWSYKAVSSLVEKDNIVKCKFEYSNTELFATYPVITCTSSYHLRLKKDTGFRYVVYATDGTNPQYDDRLPFKILHNYEGPGNSPIIELLGEDLREDSEGMIKPKRVCSGECTYNAVQYETSAGIIHIPIHTSLNRYGNAAMNDWDGNHIEINNDGGYILAPQMGAGRKEDDNSYTGVFMGEVKEAGKTIETGFFGYNRGERTIFFDAETGSATFGRGGKSTIFLDGASGKATFGESSSGQIIIDPSTDKALIYGGNYIDSDTRGSGLLIDLTTPKFQFGNRKFKIDENGILTAKGAKIEGTIEATSGQIGDFILEEGILYTEDAKKWPTIGFDGDPAKWPAFDRNGIHISSLGLAFGGAAIYWPSGDGNATPPNGPYCGITADGTLYAQEARISPYWAFDSNGVRAYAVESGDCYWEVDTQGRMQCGSISFTAGFPWQINVSKVGWTDSLKGALAIIGPFTGKTEGGLITDVMGILSNSTPIVLQSATGKVRLTGETILLEGSGGGTQYKIEGRTEWFPLGYPITGYGSTLPSEGSEGWIFLKTSS